MPEASFQDLQMALNGFKTAVQDYTVNSAIQSATEQVNQLNQQGLDESQRRQGADQLARGLALQLTGAGANGQQIQSAFQAIAPQPINNYGEMYGQAVQTGDEGMKKQATAWRDFMNEDKYKLAALKNEQASISMQRKMMMQGNQQFSKLVPQVQDRYNKGIKALNDKIGQIETIVSMPTSSIKDRLDLTTMVKSVGQDVGNIGEKEAEAVLGPTMAGKFIEMKNYMTGAASSVRTPEQAQATLKVFMKSKAMMQKIIDARTKQYAYQLGKSAKYMGVDLSPEEAMAALREDPMAAFGDAAAPAGGVESFGGAKSFLKVQGK